MTEVAKRRTLPAAPETCSAAREVDGGGARLSDLGAWAGRAAGCMPGKPVEDWSREQLRSYLELASAYPLANHIPAADPMLQRWEFNRCGPTTLRWKVHEVTRDDDIHFTIVGLIVLETSGRSVDAKDVRPVWITYLP